MVIFGSESGGRFELTDGHVAIKPEVFAENITSSKISLMFEVDSIEEIMKCAERMGIAPAAPLRHYYYGSLEIVYLDPDGTRVVFVQQYSKEVAEKLGASEEFG